MAIRRVLTPEILDHLDFRDPEAVRSRFDLRVINTLMGNVRWVGRSLRKMPFTSGIVEIGAGEGMLCGKIVRQHPGVAVTGIDRAPRPAALPDSVAWISGDLFVELPGCRADVLAGVMILHHFSDGQLSALGGMLDGFRGLCFCEPWRAEWPLVLGGMMAPFSGRVTRHDMPASIRAGFVPGELPALLGLSGWHIEETTDWRGALRLRAWRK